MKRRILALILSAALLLSGCSSLLDRSYSTVEEHSGKYWESEAADTLRAETYQDIVNDLLLLIGRHTEDAVLRLYNYKDDAVVAETLEAAATEVQQETPMGAYAVEYITSDSRSQRGYYEVTLHISYRRSAQQVQTVLNATSTSALPDLLSAALEQGSTELAVRIGYWSETDAERVAQAVAGVREKYGLSDAPAWTVCFYPATGSVGLIEFLLDGQGAADAPADGQAALPALSSEDGAFTADGQAASPALSVSGGAAPADGQAASPALSEMGGAKAWEKFH